MWLPFVPNTVFASPIYRFWLYLSNKFGKSWLPYRIAHKRKISHTGRNIGTCILYKRRLFWRLKDKFSQIKKKFVSYSILLTILGILIESCTTLLSCRLTIACSRYFSNLSWCRKCSAAAMELKFSWSFTSKILETIWQSLL